MTFDVIDPKTGEYPDLEDIASTEEWAQNLIYCDMNGFCINEDGNLILMDECGNYAYCPPDRFEVSFIFQCIQGRIEMLKCKICNTEFSPVKERHYVCRANKVSGLSTINRKEEEKAYDCFDCPNCGCQVIAQERYRAANV